MRRLIVLPGILPLALGAQDPAPAVARDTAILIPAVVTVTRVPLEQTRAPFAVSLNGRNDIQRGTPGLGLDEALAGIPGVQVDNRFNYALGERISIRGMGARAQFGVRGVRVLLDGIPMTLADGQTAMNNVDAGALARAEVIRGPASALHGNAAGGVIQLETERPFDISERPIGGTFQSTAGAFGLLRNELAAAGRTRDLAYSLALSRLSFDGYRQWNNARNDHAMARLTATRGRDAWTLVANAVDYDGQNPGGMSTAMLAANRDSAFANNTRFQTGERGTQAQLGGTWRRQLGTGGAFEFAAHGLVRSIDNPIPQRIVVIDRAAGGTRAALSGTLTIGGRPVQLAGGTEFQFQLDDRVNYVNEDGARGADTLDQHERVTNNAIFAQATASLTDRLLLLAGARFDRVRFVARDRLIGAGNADDSGERTMQAVSPSLGLTWSLSPRADVYANVSTSFETPTTSELANQESGAGGLNPVLDPQRTRSAEVGVKGRALAGRVAAAWQLALYTMRVDDALIPFEVASVPGRQYFRNAGSTDHRGVELGTRVVLPGSVALRASYTHTDARFGHYAAEADTFDGLRVPGVAANRADAVLSWEPGPMFIDWETRVSSATPVNDANTANSPGYVVHGLRLGARDVRAGGARVSPHIGVLNVFDREYNTSVVVNAFGGRYFEPGPPRSFYVGVGLTW